MYSLSYNKCEIAVEHLFPSRARIQEFYHFCCHKCHSLLCIFLFSNTLRTSFEYILTDKRFNYSETAYHNNEKHIFRPFLLLIFSIFFSTFSLLVWHLWQQKNKIAVECARGCALRAGARTSGFPIVFFVSFFRVNFPLGFSKRIIRVDLSLRCLWSKTKHPPKTPSYAIPA